MGCYNWYKVSEIRPGLKSRKLLIRSCTMTWLAPGAFVTNWKVRKQQEKGPLAHFSYRRNPQIGAISHCHICLAPFKKGFAPTCTFPRFVTETFHFFHSQLKGISRDYILYCHVNKEPDWRFLSMKFQNWINSILC